MNKDKQIKKYNHISIIGNGEDWKAKKIKECCKISDFIIAADNGLSILDELNITPDLIVGDFDSVPKNILIKYKKIPVSLQGFFGAGEGDRTLVTSLEG